MVRVFCQQTYDYLVEIRHRTLKEWRDTDKKYVSTSATKFILQSLKHNRGVIITGSPGCGKSAAAHNVALILEKKGYEIIPCDDPVEIRKYFTAEKIQVFVIDDVCGKFALNQQKVDTWEQNDGKLNKLMEVCDQNDDNDDNINKREPKFILTCRENIHVQKAFPKLTCFSLKQCSFSTKYKISPEEMRKIALSYVSENTVNDIQNVCLYDFFPLLCTLYSKQINRDPRFFMHPVEIIKNEISEMITKSEPSFLCLSLLVLKNNKLCEDEIRYRDVTQLVDDIYRDSKIEYDVSVVSIQKCLNRLKGIYITESAHTYTAIHDKMFDIISAAIAPSIMTSLIEHVDIAFLENRVQLSSIGRSSLPFVIHIPPEFERMYLQRQFKEVMKRNYWEVFGSVGTENKAYRHILLSFLKEQDICQQVSFVPGEDGATPLFVSSYLGYVDFVEYFFVKTPSHIYVKDQKGRSCFYVACENGHIEMVKHLNKYFQDKNAENSEKTTALSATCLNGHTEVAQLLLNNNADINRTNVLNQSALHFTCLNGNVNLVKCLLFGDNKADVTIRDSHGQTALHTACQKGHTAIVKVLVEFGINVNQKNNSNQTPLYLACQHGCYDTVKFMIECIYSKPNSTKTTMITDELMNFHTTETEWTVLHTACRYGHTEVAKLLIAVNMNINIKESKGCTALYLACHRGHYDTVKCLLDLNGKKIDSRVDTTIKNKDGWSALHVACYNGHNKVVKLLVDVGMTINDTTNQGFSPLYLACKKNHCDIVEFLLGLKGQKIKSAVDVTIKDHDRWSPLHAACFYGNTDIVKILVGVEININDRTTKGFTPLSLACEKGHYDIVKFLLDLNNQTLNGRVDTTIKHEGGWSALHAACFNGHRDVVKLLIDVGINVNDTSNKGFTPLYLACKRGHYDTVKCVLYSNEQTLNKLVNAANKNTNGTSALHGACFFGHTEVVKLLINVGLNINDTSNKGDTPLYIACKKGHYDLVKYLLDLNGKTLDSRVDTTITNTDGWSALHAACCNGRTEIVKLLIDVGMTINDRTNEGSTSFYLACEKGHYDTVKLLLDLNGQTLNSGVDMTIKNSNGWSVLHTSCFNGRTEIVKLLIDVGLNINDKSNKGCTLLYVACTKGHYDLVKFLLDLNENTLNSRVDTAIKHEDGWSVLHAACSNGHTEVVKLLIDVGMKINETTNEGLTPFSIACEKGHYDTVKYLLERNSESTNSRVDRTIKNADGQSALHTACFNGHTEIVKLLIKDGMNINDISNEGCTPLYAACLKGRYDTVKVLLDSNGQFLNSNVDTTIKNTDGWSVLHAACLNGHTEVVKLLIDVGMKLNAISNKRYTPLFLSCVKDHYETVKFLLDLNGQTINSRVDTTIKHAEGWSVLHAACCNGHTEIVKLLIDVGININDTTYIGITPLYLACEKGHYETVELLLDVNGQTFNSRVDTTIKQEHGWSILHAACSNGHTEVVKLLIDVGMKINDTTNEGLTPFSIACEKGHYDTVKYLLKRYSESSNSRVDRTIKNADGQSALHTTCLNGHTEIVKLLIEDGMNINDISNEGCTPLYAACLKGRYDTVKVLLDSNGQFLNSNVDTTIRNTDGWSALHAACLNGHTEVVKLLIDVGMTINDRTNEGCTPFYLACEKGYYDTVTLLLDLNGQTINCRVDTTIKHAEGWSALHAACSNGHTEIVKLLIDVGMKINDRTNEGITPFYLACEKGHFGTVKLLLDLNSKTFNSRVDITIKHEDGWSVLHAACFNGHTEVVRLLIGVGMNVNDIPNQGSTPLFLACQEGHYDTVKVLLDLNGEILNSRVDTTIKNTDGKSAFHAAYSNGHSEVVKMMTDIGINEVEKRNTRKCFCVIL